MIATVPSLLVGNPALPAQDLAALIALAKAKPDGDPQVAAQAPRRLRQPGGSRRLAAARPRTPQKAFAPIANRAPGPRFLPIQEWRRCLEASGVETIERA
jgi:hypothetical protein